eukprot:SAG31_NODE_5192_length_2689_cov_1.621622_3_plen_663_part_01
MTDACLLSLSRCADSACTFFSWIKFCQRFQLLHPQAEKYSAEIETALYNAMLRQMVQRPKHDDHDETAEHPGHVYPGPAQGLPPRPGERVPLPRGTPEQQAAALTSQIEADEQTANAAALALQARITSSPPLCNGGAQECLMVEAAANTYFAGDFHSATATSVKACEAACLADIKCVAMTYSLRPTDPCEIYTVISRTVYQSADTTVAVKCNKTEVGKPATVCGHFSGVPTPPSPPPGPELPPGIRYHAVMEGVQEHPNNVNTCCEGQGTRMFGSMPEYIYSLEKKSGGPTGIWVNLFAASVLSFNASVAGGTGGRPGPQPAVPTRPKSGIVPGPPPPMTWQLLEKDGFWPGDHNPGNNPKDVSTLEECKASCIASGPGGGNSFYSCMGITWKNEPAPPPPSPSRRLCTGRDCVMVELSPPGAYYTGEYSQAGTANVTSLANCKAACMADPKCTQLTWVVRPADPCVLYSKIYDQRNTGHGVQGWVKCTAGSTDGAKCADILPGKADVTDRCQQFQAIDMSHQARAKGPSKSPGTDQWMVLGRQIRVQHDFGSFDPKPFSNYSASKKLAASAVTEAQLAVTTDFPYGNNVTMTMTWATRSITAVAVNLRLRIPSWIAGNLRLCVLLALPLLCPLVYPSAAASPSSSAYPSSLSLQPSFSNSPS